MSNLDVKICVCADCVLNGSMDIIESVEHIKEMSKELDDNYNKEIEIVVTPVNSLGDSKHGAESPKVSINDEIYSKADNQTIMADIFAKLKKEVDI